MKSSARAWCRRLLVVAFASLIQAASQRAFGQGPGVALALSEGSGTTASDASGNSNAGTLHGVPWTTGQYGNAIHADGTGHDVQIASSSTLDITGGFTIETWIKPAAD